jgi:predicted N-formylglutamate amidohydrolase
VQRLLQLHAAPIIFSFHSFPRFQTSYDKPFPWNFTLHYNREPRVAEVFKDYFKTHHPDIFLGDNEPYDLTQLDTGGAVIHGESRGLPALLIEIPNDRMNKDEETDFWSDVIVGALKQAAYLYNPDSYQVPAAA